MRDRCPLGFLLYDFPIFFYVIHVIIGMGPSSALGHYLTKLVEDHMVMLQTTYHYNACIFRPDDVFSIKALINHETLGRVFL